MRKIVVALILIFISKYSFAEFGRSTTFDDREICEKSKGVWRQFGNTAADNCEAKMDRFLIAAQALIYACDCGKSRCWNDDKCILISDYKKIYDQKQIEEAKKNSQAKKQREQEYRDSYSQRIRELAIAKSQNAQNGSESNQSVVNNNIAQFNSQLGIKNNLLNVSSNNSIQQNAQNMVDQGTEAARKIEKSSVGKILTLPAIPTVQNNSNNDGTIIQSNDTPITTGPTPFFLQQQEKAKQESAEAANNLTKNLTTTNQTATNQASSANNLNSQNKAKAGSDIPDLPKIPLP